MVLAVEEGKHWAVSVSGVEVFLVLVAFELAFESICPRHMAELAC
jgi:hypothetical protein